MDERRSEEAAGNGPRPIPAQDARQGRIVLDRPWRRRVFFGGLIGFVLLALISALFF